MRQPAPPKSTFLAIYSNSLIMGEIMPFLSTFTFIFDHIFYCAFFIILILVGIDEKNKSIWKIFGMISLL
jgi:hypothetical protein